MGVMYTKPANLKYTDLAIYIDANAYKIKNEGEFPKVESTIYEYLYHIVYALACKAAYFRNFPDYDSFACYAAGEIYMTMRKKLINEGKDVRGKKTIPIKSSLNFIKATMFPLKINYQKENFGTVIDPGIHSNIDSLRTNLTESIQQNYRASLIESYQETAEEIPRIVEKVIQNTPFRNNKLFCKKLSLSVTLTLLNDFTLPKKMRKRLLNSIQKQSAIKSSKQFVNTYAINVEPALLWHLDDSFRNYVRILTIKVKKLLSISFEQAIHSGELSDDLIDSLMRNIHENYVERGETE